MVENPRRHHVKKLKGIGGALASLALVACGSSSPTPPPENPGQAVLGAAEGQNALETSSKLLNDFIAKWINKPADFDNAYGAQCVDLVQFWSKAQGGPRFVGDFAHEIFLQSPDFYESILGYPLMVILGDPKKVIVRPENPRAGDILVWGTKFNNVGGHTGIATGKLDNSGKEIVFEQNDPWDSKSHLQSYSLDDPSIIGWLRAKNSSEISDKPNSEAILDEYLSLDNLENQDIDTQIVTRALRFWFEEFTTKETPKVVARLQGGNETLQISTNLDEFVPQIPTLFLPGPGNNFGWSNKIDSIFDIHYELTGPNARKVEMQIKNLQIAWFDRSNFSDSDKANGFQRMEEVNLNYISRGKMYNFTTNTWDDFSDWGGNGYEGLLSNALESFQYVLKNGQLIMGTDEKYYGFVNPTNKSDDPTQEVPQIIYR